MLLIDGVHKTYPGDVRALQGIALSLPAGAFGLLGPNGAGKSTLMQMLATLQRPDAGTISIDGIDVVRSPEAARAILGYMPQELGFDPRLRVLDVMYLMAGLKRVRPGREARAQAKDRLEAVGLWPMRHRTVGALSGGMRRRLGLAQALLGTPRLLLLDEPTAGLDPEQRERVLGVLADMGSSAVIIVSTHIADDVRRLCPTVGILHLGELLFHGTVQELLAPLRGRLWEAPAATSILSGEVLRTSLDGGVRHLRVLAHRSPGEDFRAVEPVLEDGYAHWLGSAAPARR